MRPTVSRLGGNVWAELTVKKSAMKYYTVQFVADYFVMTVNVEASNEEMAEATASQLIQDYYDINVLSFTNEVTAWSNGKVL